MASRSRGGKSEARVPIGIVLLSVGAIIFGTAFLLWALAPTELRATVTLLPSSLTVASTKQVRTIKITPTSAQDIDVPSGSVLPPQTPLDEQQLPSFAAASEAPSNFHIDVAHQPERLVIPDLGVDAPIRAVSVALVEQNGRNVFQWQVPIGYEVGWHNTSAPLGQAGNTVWNGHNSIHGEVFRDLVDLEIGSEVILYDAERSYHYAVSVIELAPENDQPLSVRLENARLIETTLDERITLVSCWPYSSNSQRIMVIATPAHEIGS